jgi:hypothetical protein
MQCFDECGDSAWVAQHTEYLRGKSASVIGIHSFFSAVFDYPDERFYGASVAKFLERFRGGCCSRIIHAKCPNERVRDLRVAEVAERIDEGFTELELTPVPFLLQCPNEWFYCFGVAYTTECASGFFAESIT